MSLESIYDNVSIEWGAGYRDTWSLAAVWATASSCFHARRIPSRGSAGEAGEAEGGAQATLSWDGSTGRRCALSSRVTAAPVL